MTLILEAVLVKFLADKVKEKATSDLTDAAWKPVTGLVEAGQEKLLEAWGRIDPEFADVLTEATAASYVAAVQEITEQYLNNQKHKIFRAQSDVENEKEIKKRVKALAIKPSYEITPQFGTAGISPSSGADDDQKITAELMTKVREDIGELPEELKQRFEQRILRYLRQHLWKRLAKSLKDGKGSALMSAFLFDLLSRVGAAAEAAKSYAAQLAGQMVLEFQLDRFEVDQDLLRIKTRYFVNRTQVLREIDEFLATASGYFVIRAEGGMGKTSVAAKYVIENGECLYHFLNRELGPGERRPAGYTVGSPRNSIESCLAVLCQQLQDWLDAPTAVSADLKILENRFNALLRMKAERRPQDKLVIVIDGLDEAQDLDTFFNYFPAQPPSNVYFVMTTRPLVNLPKGFQATSIDLGYLDQVDVREMVAQADEGLGRNEKFIADVYEVTGGHPLYLYHVVDEVSALVDGARQLVDQIPPGAVKNLDEYYRWQLERLINSSVTEERKVGQDTLDLLRTLSLLREAVTEEQLKDITGIAGIDYIKAYRKASRYLTERSVGGVTVYTLFHLKFQEVVLNDFKRLSRKERKNYLQKILDYCRGWTERSDQDASNSNDYTFRHYAEHLYEFGQEVRNYDPLFQLLSNGEFLAAKVARFGQFSALLPDCQLGLKAAAATQRWLEALRFSLLEGYVREVVKFRWGTGAIFMDAVRGEVDLALTEARAISVLDERALQMLLIAEWLLKSGESQRVLRGSEIVKEVAGIWSVTRPFVTYQIEEEILDFVTRVLFEHDQETAGSFLSIVNTPGTPKELTLLLILARLDREGAFADPPARSITAPEYGEIVSSSRQICTTYLGRRYHPYKDAHDGPLTEGALKDVSLAQVFFRLATGQELSELELGDAWGVSEEVYRMSDEIQEAGLPADDRELRGLLKTVWRFWQDYGESKTRKGLPDPQKFIDEVRQLKGFMPIYKPLRSYLPVLTKEFAEQISPALKEQSQSLPAFSDLIRFRLAKEAASHDLQLAEKIVGKMTRPRLRALACAYLIGALEPAQGGHKKALASKVFTDLQAKDSESKELLDVDYQDEVIHALSVIAREDESLDWTVALAPHFYSDDVPLMQAKVVFGGGEKIGLSHVHNLEQRLKNWSYKIYDEDELRYAPAYLAELARAGEVGGLDDLKKFLSSVKEFCVRDFGSAEGYDSQQVIQKLFARDSFILFLENLTHSLDETELEWLLKFAKENLPDLLRRHKVVSYISIRYKQLGDQRAEALADEIVKDYSTGISDDGLSTNDLVDHVLPTLANIHYISPAKSSSAFEHLTSTLGVDAPSIQERETAGPFMPDLFFSLASIANKIERHDLRDRYLGVAESFANRVTTWGYEDTLDRIGRNLEGIKNPKIMISLLLLIRSAGQFEGASVTYQMALAHAAAHFATGLLTLAQDSIGEINAIDSILDEVVLRSV